MSIASKFAPYPKLEAASTMEELFWPLILLLLGLSLLVAETALPSAGLLGCLAAGSLLASAYFAWTHPGTGGLRWVGLEVVLVPTVWFGAVHHLPRTKFGRRVYLQPPNDLDLDEAAPSLLLAQQVGRPCRVLTPLRPSGSVEMEGRRVEAIAESGLIDAGTAGLIVAVRSGRVIVRAL